MSYSQQPVRVTITSATILKVIAVVIALLFVYAIRDILLLILVSMVLAAAFDPWVDRLQKHGLPRLAGILIIYLGLFGIFGLVIVMLIPPVLEQIAALYQNFPSIIAQFSSALDSVQGFSLNTSLEESFNASFGDFETTHTVGKVMAAIGNFFGGLFGILAILVMTFYMVIKEDNIEKLVKLASPERYHKFLTSLLKNISEKLGVWLRTQLLIGLLVGVMVYIALSFLQVEYALVLALLAVVTELIPFIGPWIGAIPGVLVAFTQSPVVGLFAAGMYLLIQQLESHFITPRIMSKAVGLSPILVIVALLIGAKIAGIVGALLAVPVALIIQTAIHDFNKIPD